MKQLVLIPTFNEELSLPNVIDQIKNELPGFDILVIDDGSTDSSYSIAIEKNVKAISLPFNLGVGGALRVGFKYAFAKKYDVVVQIDADGQHLPSEVSKLLAASESDCVVVGSRFYEKFEDFETGVAKKFAIKILAKITSYICKTKLTDVSSGFRLARGKTVELFANSYPRDYLGDTVESLILAHKNGFKLIEVPVIMKQRLHGSPSQNFIKSLWHLIRVLLIVSLSLLQRSEKPVVK